MAAARNLNNSADSGAEFPENIACNSAEVNPLLDRSPKHSDAVNYDKFYDDGVESKLDNEARPLQVSKDVAPPQTELHNFPSDDVENGPTGVQSTTTKQPVTEDLVESIYNDLNLFEVNALRGLPEVSAQESTILDPQAAKAVFEMIDINNDGTLTIDEFYAGLSKAEVKEITKGFDDHLLKKLFDKDTVTDILKRIRPDVCTDEQALSINQEEWVRGQKLQEYITVGRGGGKVVRRGGRRVGPVDVVDLKLLQQPGGGAEGVDDVVSPNESLAAIAGGILRLAHVLGGAGEEGAASVFQLTLGGGEKDAEGEGVWRREEMTIRGEAEEKGPENYSTKLVKVEGLLSLRLALLLEVEKKEGSCEGSMSEPPGEVSTGERKKGGGEKERRKK
ncbi:hypothetical protein CYMTET_7791 [Cymbomonas tetramitiformis]|uniref:EF-hand domain-containing protein n=1 Tax=Cymbomonas tetramitiformis TaxID=36881 RepID=A0AAE0LGM8_9CHLO|nr:hypothetical protein CYMTET_7791 [Cymbomonas tetramitiformis]